MIARTDDGMSTRDAVRGHRGLELRAVATPPGTGLTVVDLADTWCDLGELPRGSLSLTDLVVAGDAVVAQLQRRELGFGVTVTPGVNMANPVNAIYDFIPATGAPDRASVKTRPEAT